jgi:hypothetical protein
VDGLLTCCSVLINKKVDSWATEALPGSHQHGPGQANGSVPTPVVFLDNLLCCRATNSCLQKFNSKFNCFIFCTLTLFTVTVVPKLWIC